MKEALNFVELTFFPPSFQHKYHMVVNFHEYFFRLLDKKRIYGQNFLGNSNL